MTDTWNKLWAREITEDETNWRVTLEWLQEVKAEGDRIQETLKHCNLSNRGYSVKNRELMYNVASLTEGYDALKDKLDDVKNWFNDWINPWLDKAGEEGFMLPKKRMTSLKKILEGE